MSWILVLQMGCATPAVHARWKALDAVERVSFAAEAVRPDQAILHWRVESKHLADRSGRSEIGIHLPNCDAIEFLIDERILGRPLQPDWVAIDLRSQQAADEDLGPAVQPEACRARIRARAWSGKSSPTFDLTYQNRRFELETPPPRRHAWIPVYPFAAIADAVLVLPIALVSVTWAMLGVADDFTWVPGSEPNWHREESRRKREARERER